MAGYSLLAVIGFGALAFYLYMFVVFFRAAGMIQPPKDFFAKAMWALTWPLTVWPLIKQLLHTAAPDPE